MSHIDFSDARTFVMHFVDYHPARSKNNRLNIIVFAKPTIPLQRLKPYLAAFPYPVANYDPRD